jgi:magnesium-transporting ATPase (P-type)
MADHESSPLNPAITKATKYKTTEDPEKPNKDPPTDHEMGLSTEDANMRLEKWGYNELPSSRKGKWEMLLDTLVTPMACIIWISIFIEMGVSLKIWKEGGTGSTGPIQDFVDMWVLIVLQFFNSFVGWYEEIKAGDAVAELQKSLAPKASVKRDGKWKDIPGREVVPGDLVCLPLGGAVPGDCRLVEGSKPLMIDQASLTGESLPVKFRAGGCAKMGSTVVQGEAEAIVEETGQWTFFGKTASLLNEADNGEDSNLTEKLFYILIYIVAVGLPCVITVLITLVNRHSEDPQYSVIANVAVVIVAIVPIANAVVCTSTLAFGSLIMSQEGAIVTRLTSIEEMAGMSMLCSDKTGTPSLFAPPPPPPPSAPSHVHHCTPTITIAPPSHVHHCTPPPTTTAASPFPLSTGTLTLNKMVMQTIIANTRETPDLRPGSKGKKGASAELLKSFDFPENVADSADAQDVLKYATLAAKWKETPKVLPLSLPLLPSPTSSLSPPLPHLISSPPLFHLISFLSTRRMRSTRSRSTRTRSGFLRCDEYRV